jgi:serine O-acetyltransferase
MSKRSGVTPSSVVDRLFWIYRTCHVFYFGLLNISTINDLRHIFSCDIPFELPRSTDVPHPVGIVIGRGIRIGDGCTILHNVTIGVSEMGNGVPVIGDNVYIGCGAVILGDVDIGDGSTIGANSVVLSDVPQGATVAGVPAEVVSGGSE